MGILGACIGIEAPQVHIIIFVNINIGRITLGVTGSGGKAARICGYSIAIENEVWAGRTNRRWAGWGFALIRRG